MQRQQAIKTTTLSASPTYAPQEHTRKKHFSLRANAILEFLPGGSWLSLALETPMILGRGTRQQNNADLLDLTSFDAHKLGVSRQHCQLQRQGQQLVVIDLDSANGTHVNGLQLTPGEPYTLAHGDQLLLGALRCNVLFHTG